MNKDIIKNEAYLLNYILRQEGGLRKRLLSKKSLPQQPLISIVTVVYNGEKYLEQTIQSVINQSYTNIEFILIDGGSTDHTVEIIKKYENHIDYWMSEPDQGIYDAWNKAIKIATGEWISFLGSDDILLPNAMADYIAFVKSDQNSELEFISSRIELVTNDLRLKRLYGTAWHWDTFKVYMNTAHVGALHHKKLFINNETFNIHYKIAADYEFLLRKGENLKAGFLDKVTVKMRNEEGASVRGIQTQFETRRAKIETANRHYLPATVELIVAILKMKVRKLFNL